jgi:hypothetical protein
MRYGLRVVLCIAVGGQLGLLQGCTQRHHAYDYIERDGTVLSNALCNYVIDFGWDGLLDLCKAIDGRQPGANRSLLGVLTGKFSGEDTAGCNPTGIAYISLHEVRLDRAGQMLDHWGHPYRITLSPDLDERGQVAAIRLLVSSSGHDGVDDHGKGDDQAWSAVLRW